MNRHGKSISLRALKYLPKKAESLLTWEDFEKAIEKAKLEIYEPRKVEAATDIQKELK